MRFNYWDHREDFPNLKGVTLTGIERSERDGNEALIFTADDGSVYEMFHQQDCCESVYIEDIVGDLEDLIDSPIVRAEERGEGGDDEDGYGTYTWTFYELATIKGSVTIRWYGSSNGYYSESVDFFKVK